MVSLTSPADARKGGIPQCVAELDACDADLEACEPEAQTFPGDGYDNPDDVGVSGHGLPLSHTDNGDGTFTDNNTGLTWEKKLAAHDFDGN